MRSCEDCGLPVDEAPTEPTSEPERAVATRCEACARLADGDPGVRVRPLSASDLELVYAWRNNPEMYRYFREQDGPLSWSDHVDWFESRSERRHDFLVRYDGRRVGVVSLDEDDQVGIYLGDHSARGEGVATAAMAWLCERFERRAPLFADIDAENEASQAMVERCGFEAGDRDGGWIEYVYEP